MERKWKKVWKSYMHKDCFVNQIVEIILCWAFYYVNDNKKVNLITLQNCILYYLSQQSNFWI
jgi:hypothetical protein